MCVGLCVGVLVAGGCGGGCIIVVNNLFNPLIYIYIYTHDVKEKIDKFPITLHEKIMVGLN